MTVNNVVWKTIGELGIKLPTRGCRGGASIRRSQDLIINRAPYPQRDALAGIHDVQQSIETIVHGGRPETHVTSRGSVSSNIIAVDIKKNDAICKQEKVKVGYLNARSVRNKALEINEFIKDSSLDILAITETWLSPGDKDNIVVGDITPPGYEIHHVPRPHHKGGGVALVTNSSFKSKKEKVTNFKSFEVIEMKVLSKKDCIRIAVVYRPPAHSKTVFLDEFQEYLDAQSSSSGKLVVIGDFNMHIDKDTDPDATKLRDLLFSMNLDQHVHAPTHILGHTLDLVITRSSEAVLEDLESHPPIMSDHTPLTFSLVTKKPPSQKKLVSYRKLKDIDLDRFKADVEASQLLQAPPNTGVNELVHQYNQSLSNILDNHAPLKTKYVTDRTDTPWYNEEVLEAKREKRRAERRYLKNRLTVNLEILRQARSRVNALCKKAKSEFYRQKIEDCAKDQKSLFKITNELMHRQRDASLPTFHDPFVLANDFAQFFTEKVEKISQTFTTVSSNASAREETEQVPQISELEIITKEELKKVIISGNSKCCHLDPIPTTLLKECIDLLLPTLTSIVNGSLTGGEFPSALKFATLVPLLKKPSLDKEQPRNYRPVSNLAYLGKLIEKVFVDQMNDHRERNRLHPVNQSAYRKNHSTETALVRIVNDILIAMDNKMCVALVMLDLSAAFDTVSHSILLRRLEEDFGVKGSALVWLESYFSGRTQAVNINGTLSIPRPLTTGMPQGSRIGPTEFPPYTSPLFDIAKKHNIQVHMYADDTQLFVPFKVEEYDEAMNRLEACVAEMRLWLSENHLKLNDEKTEFVVIGQKQLINRIGKEQVIHIGDSMIKATQHAKNIGAMIDCNMDMRMHVNYVARASYHNLRNISHIRSNITEEAAATLTHAFISSKLDNLNSLLVGLPDCVLKKLQLIQNNAARLLLKKKKRDHVTPMLKQLHWLPIKSRIKYKVCLLTYKALNNAAPQYISSLLTSYEPPRALRSAGRGLLKQKVPRLKRIGGRAFSVVAPQMWNSLPYALRQSSTLDSFKVCLKTHLFQEAFV